MQTGNRRYVEANTQYMGHYNQQPDQQAPTPSESSAYSASQTRKLTSHEEERIYYALSNYNAPAIAVRPSATYFPKSKRIQKSTQIPFSLNIVPFPNIASTDDYPKAEFGNKNPVVRCDKCRAYINPFAVFQDGGQEYICNMCGDVNHTPRYYYSQVDKKGVRLDVNERPELCNGVFDIKAGTEYMSRPPMPPIYYFVIDVSQEGIANGSLNNIAHILHEFATNDYFWGDVRTKIGFIAYDTNVHIISLDPKAKRPKITTLTDIENLVKLPVFEHLLVTLSEAKDAVMNLINALPKMFNHTTDNGSNLFSAIRVSASILKRTGGRIYAFQSNSNLKQEPGLFKGHINSRDKKHNMCPNSPKFLELTPDMQQSFVSCNLFIFGNQYKDIVTIAELPRYLNGDIYYYPDNVERNHRFYYDLRNSLAREHTWETVFRVRVSSGWRITNKYGNYSVKSSGDLLSLPNTDVYKSLIYEVELDSEVAPTDTLYLQTALLYTTAKGERRIRVINYGIQLTDNLADIHESMDSQAVACTLMRKALLSMYEASSLFEVREDLVVRASRIYTELAKGKYKEEELSPQNVVFLMSILGFIKHPLFIEKSWSDGLKIDALNAFRIKLNMLTVDETMLYFNPYLFSVHNLANEDASYHDENGAFVFPNLLNLSINSLAGDGIYLMDAGDTLYMYVGCHTQSHILHSLFSINSLSEVEQLTEEMMYQNMEDPLMSKVSALISELRSRKTEQYAYLHIIKEGEASEIEHDLYAKLIEDKLDLPNSYNISFSDFVSSLVKQRRI